MVSYTLYEKMPTPPSAVKKLSFKKLVDDATPPSAANRKPTAKAKGPATFTLENFITAIYLNTRL
jgi:hypothetical protein